MTQTDIPAWLVTLQAKLVAALDAVWRIVDGGGDPAEIRHALDKAKAIGQLAAVARKVGLITPAGRKPLMDAATAGFHATQALADLSVMVQAPTAAPGATQAEYARRALDKLKGGRRGRL
jgi:DNA-binding phage protein